MRIPFDNLNIVHVQRVSDRGFVPEFRVLGFTTNPNGRLCSASSYFHSN